MIRPGRMMDVLRLVELLEWAQERSIYAGKVAVDRDYAKRFLGQLIHKHGGVYDGGTFCMVAEDESGVVQAFLTGALDRVLNIGDMLQAFDIHFVATDKASARAAPKLFAAYLAWARNNPRVYEITASRSDSMNGAERVDILFERSGFEPCGAIYRLINEPAAKQEAA